MRGGMLNGQDAHSWTSGMCIKVNTMTTIGMAKKHSPGLVERCSLAHSEEVISNEKDGEGLIDSCVLRPSVKPGYDISSLLHLSH